MRWRRRRAGDDGAPSAADRSRVAGLLERFGTNPNSFMVRYEADWRYHFGERIDGAVCYVRVGRTVVAWGDPLCAPDDGPALLGEFLRAMRARGLRTSMLALQEETARAAMALGCSVLNIGSEPAFDLPSWHVPTGDRGKKLRWCVNHARRAGTTIEEYRPGATGRDRRSEAEVEEVQQRWEAGLGRGVIRSFLGLAPMDELADKRLFLARRDGRVEAFLACAPVYGRDGWYLEDLVRLPDATNGATELLVVDAMARLQRDGAAYATLGIAPLRGAEHQIDPRARWLVPALRWAFEYFDGRYHFASLSRYKAKFGPSGWEPRYAAFSPARPSLGTVRATMSVLDPSPEPEPFRERPPVERLVLIQVAIWALASILALVPDRFAGALEARVGYLAPVGVAGVGLALMLYVVASRVSRRDERRDRIVLASLEAVVAVGALLRIHDGRWAPLELVIAVSAVAIGVLLLVHRPDARTRNRVAAH